MRYLVKRCPCNNQMMVKYYKKDRKKYCSKKCFYKYRTRPKGLKYKIIVKNKGWFKDGNKPYNFGNETYCLDGGYLRSDKGRQHRQIFEKYIGRKLKNTEIIHHVNGKKTDNRLQNLQYFKNTAAHSRIHQFCKRHKLSLTLFNINYKQLYG